MGGVRTQRKNRMVTRQSGRMDSRSVSSAARVLLLPAFRLCFLKMAMMPGALDSDSKRQLAIYRAVAVAIADVGGKEEVKS